jgi:hypothetical protein
VLCLQQPEAKETPRGFGAVIAIGTSEVSNTKLLEDKDHEASIQAGEKGKSSHWQEAREEGPAAASRQADDALVVVRSFDRGSGSGPTVSLKR